MSTIDMDSTPEPARTGWAGHAAHRADPDTLTALARVHPTDLTGTELVDAVIAAEKALSLLTGLQMRLLTALAEPFTAGDPTRLATRLARKNNLAGDPTPDQVQNLIPDAAACLAASEIAAALRISPVTAGIRIRDAASMTGALQPTLHALEEGHIDRGKARVIADHCQPLTVEHTTAVQHLVLPAAAGLSTSELRDHTAQAVITIDPHGARERHHAAAARRDLTLRAHPDAMASLTAFLPADGAVKIFQISDLLATGTAGTPDDPRGVGARRVDALIDIADHLLTHGHLDLTHFLDPAPAHTHDTDEHPGNDATSTTDTDRTDGLTGTQTSRSRSNTNAGAAQAQGPERTDHADHKNADHNDPDHNDPDHNDPDHNDPDHNDPDHNADHNDAAGVVDHTDPDATDAEVSDAEVSDADTNGVDITGIAANGRDGAVGHTRRNIGVNVNEHGVGEHGVDQHGVDQHRVGEHSVGEHSVGEHRVDQHRVDQHGVGEDGVDEHRADGDRQAGVPDGDPIEDDLVGFGDGATGQPGGDQRGTLTPTPTPAPIAPAPTPAGTAPAGPVNTARSPRVLTRQGRRPHLSVTIGLNTLAGLNDLPALLAGFGAIPACLGRAIATSAGTVTALLTDPTTGLTSHAGNLTYRPDQQLRDRIAALTPTCQFPSCRQPVWRCDIDHREPFNTTHPERGGHTDEQNTGPFCRRHHLLGFPSYRGDIALRRSAVAENRRKFDRDFREGAVRIVRETGKPIARVARDLGINEGTLGNWIARDRQARVGGDGALSEDERAELVRLRRENAELVMERDVLKRSVALWVKDAMAR